jgi:hypothetical protein
MCNSIEKRFSFLSYTRCIIARNVAAATGGLKISRDSPMEPGEPLGCTTSMRPAAALGLSKFARYTTSSEVKIRFSID